LLLLPRFHPLSAAMKEKYARHLVVAVATFPSTFRRHESRSIP
jgi:hypothetical protein